MELWKQNHIIFEFLAIPHGIARETRTYGYVNL